MQTDLAPIVLFVYNRPWHTRQTLEALSKNLLSEQSKLFIYSDGAKENATYEQIQKINRVREVIKEKKWCGEVEIIERERNLGLANSVITGVTEIVNKFGKIIILEDDLVTSIGFLKYMNDALNLYEKEEKVMHISGYMFPIKNPDKLPGTFFYNATSCWGWGTWSRAWRFFEHDTVYLLEKIKDKKYKFNIEGSYLYFEMLESLSQNKVDSWAIKWYASAFLSYGLCLHPNISLVRNIGHDNEGVHCNNGWWSKIYNEQEVANYIQVKPIELIEYKEARIAIKELYKEFQKLPLHVKMNQKIKSLLKLINN